MHPLAHRSHLPHELPQVAPSCPKGPCGGTLDGKCEVIPELDGIWTNIEKKKHPQKLHLPPRQELYNTASYVNLFNGNDRTTRLPHEFIDSTHLRATSELSNKMFRGEVVVTLEIASPLTEKGLPRVEAIMDRVAGEPMKCHGIHWFRRGPPWHPASPDGSGSSTAIFA